MQLCDGIVLTYTCCLLYIDLMQRFPGMQGNIYNIIYHKQKCAELYTAPRDQMITLANNTPELLHTHSVKPSALPNK